MTEGIEDVINILNSECAGCKKLDDKMNESFKEMFGLFDDIEDIYYTNFNLIFFDEETYERLRYVMTDCEEILKLESNEFNTFLAIFRYSAENPIRSILS